MQRDVATVADYLASVPEKQQPVVDQLRKLIFGVAPKIREVIRYGMISYEDTGVLYVLAAQKQYVSLYLATEAVSDWSEELKNVKHGKCCLRFRTLDEIPIPTIKGLLIHAKALEIRGTCDG